MASKLAYEQKHHAPAYVTFFVNGCNDMVIVQHEANQVCLPSFRSPQIPSCGPKMSECFSKQLQNLCGISCKLIFLYSTINEVYTTSPPYAAMFEIVSAPDSQKNKPIPLLTTKYKWMSISSVYEHMKQSFSSVEHNVCYQLAMYVLERLRRQALTNNDFRPWELPTWHVQTTKEAEAVLRRFDYDLISPFEQYSITPNAAVLFAETNKGRVYLKASNRLEGKVTLLAASFAPELVRKPIFVDEQSQWMLMNDYGTPMEDKFDVKDFESLCVSLAKLQIQSRKHMQQMKEEGIPFESAESLVERTIRITEDIEFRRTLGTCKGFDILAEDGMPDVRDCYEPLTEFLRELYERKQIPLSLVHGDLHRGNIISTKDGSYVLFDWGCARIDLSTLDALCLEDQLDSAAKQNASMKSYFLAWNKCDFPSQISLCRSPLHLKVRLQMSLEPFESAKSRNCTLPMSREDVLSLVYVLVDIMEATETN